MLFTINKIIHDPFYFNRHTCSLSSTKCFQDAVFPSAKSDGTYVNFPYAHSFQRVLRCHSENDVMMGDTVTIVGQKGTTTKKVNVNLNYQT